MFFSSLDFVIPEKMRPIKILKVKKLRVCKIYYCKHCGSEAPKYRTLCKVCLAIKSIPPPPKPSRPVSFPCIRCGCDVPVGAKARPKLCDTCRPVSIAEAKKCKYDSDPEYRRMRYDQNNQNAKKRRRESGARTMADWNVQQRINAERRRLDTPTKTCNLCGVTKDRIKFSKGKACNTCVDKARRLREKRPDHPKRIQMDIEAERREILKRFDLFGPERAEAQRLNKLRAKVKERSNPVARLDRNVSELVRIALKRNKLGWRASVGWTIGELKAHIEKYFRFGMTWENYGKWHLDHIKPRSLFTYNSPHDAEFKECWALNNLQPLWASENLSKNDTYPCPYHDNLLVLLS